MQYTENYQYRKPVIGVDIADIKDMNFNSDRTDALIHNTQISLAPAYDLNETYNTGDVVMYETLMYKCKEDNVTGVWVPEKWERTTAGEEGAGGGGTSVVPNPQGEPTDTLNTIGIDGTIFDIAGSGGGGTGEGSFYKETTLWSGSDSATMTLSESFKDYDAIMVVAKTAYNNTEYSMSSVWLTSYLSYHINDGMRFGLTGDSWYIYFSITDETTFAKQDQYYLYISEIKGLKFGGGKATRIDLLWDYINDNSGNIYWSGSALTLNGDIRNYDEVVVEIVSAQGDVSDQWKSSYQWRLLVDPLINSFEPGTFTICSYDQRSAKFQFTNTTLQKLLGNGAENGVIRVYGVTYGGESKASEIIPISAGDGTTSRTFTFDKTPKFIKIYWEDTALDGGWTLDAEIAWGQPYANYKAHSRATSITGLTGGLAQLTYGSDGKSVTVIGGNAFGAWNTANGSGLMFVDYGGVTRTGGSGEASEYIPYSNKNNIVCEATLDNFDASSLEWGDGESPIILSQIVSMYNNEAVSIPVKTSGVIAYSDVGGNKQPYTAYMVCKAQTSGTYTRLLSALESHSQNMGAMVFGTDNINLGSWNNSVSTGLSATSDYIVCAIQYTGYGLGYCKVNNIDLSPFPLVGSNRHITIGRTDIGSGGDQEPCDILVKYFGVVEGTDTRKAINENVAYLMDKFGIN